MSSEGFQKRRCIIKKLDFENCIVTNIKTKARRRKKLRARITREIEDYFDVPEDLRPSEKPLDPSPVLTREADLQVQTSPVLTGAVTEGRESPVFLKRKRISHFEKGEKLREDATVKETFSPPSPVFKFSKRNKILDQSPNRCQQFKNTFKKGARFGYYNEEGSSSGLESCYQIDDATSQESKDSVGISSVESASAKNRSFSTFSVDTSSVTSRNSFGELVSNGPFAKKCDSPRPNKRNHKKNSLVGRLHKLQQKQASEKLLWQHQNRKSSSSGAKFSVVSFWREEFIFFLKCRSLSGDLSTTFLIVDCRWVPNLKNVKQASILRVHPPWQELTIEEFNATVLINVICLDLLDEEKEEEPVTERRTFVVVPAERFEIHEKLFIDSLFCSSNCGFLC